MSKRLFVQRQRRARVALLQSVQGGSICQCKTGKSGKARGWATRRSLIQAQRGARVASLHVWNCRQVNVGKSGAVKRDRKWASKRSLTQGQRRPRAVERAMGVQYFKARQGRVERQGVGQAIAPSYSKSAELGSPRWDVQGVRAMRVQWVGSGVKRVG